MKKIFILGNHKSGTSLLRNLMDSHNKLFVIPFESHFAEYLNWWISYDLRKKRYQDFNKVSFVKKSYEYLKNKNNTKKQEHFYTDGNINNFINVEKYYNYLMNKNIKNDKQMIDEYFKAIYFSMFDKEISSDLIIVEKSVENTEFALKLNLFFPDSKFIHIIRNPYANIVSLRNYTMKLSKKKNYPYMKQIIYSLMNSWYFLNRNSELLSNYKVINYEKLVENVGVIMTEISHFLNIRYDEKLEIPTQLGQTWKGNSTTDRKFNGVSKKRISEWKNEIFQIEIQLINKGIGNIMNKYGYEKIEKSDVFRKLGKLTRMLPGYFFNELLYKYL